MSEKDYDQFNDIKHGSYGMFDNSAIKAHDSVRAAVTPGGVVLEFECQGCSGGQQLTLEWPEVVALKYGVDPAFVYRGRPNIVREPMSFQPIADENAWRPVAACSKCNWHYAIRIGFEEPEQWLMRARRSNYIPQENNLSQFCSAFANGNRPQQGMQPR